MDWFSWLSKTGLDPSLVYEYGVALTQNELEEDDIEYFNHEFLQSMGISIAKHRLEILKLASRRNITAPNFHRPVSRLIITAIKRAKRRVSKYIRTWVRRDHHHQDNSADLAIVPMHYTHSSRWKGDMLKRRNKRVLRCKQSERLLLTNGTNSTITKRFSSPVVRDLCCKEEKEMGGHRDDHGDSYWSTAVEEIRWDALFQDLKPT